MKKLLLLGFIGLALMGCGEKKVTEEMLIGNWECEQTQQTAKWKSGSFQDYDAPQSVVYPISFLKQDNELFLGRPDSDWKTEQNFKYLNQKSVKTEGNRKAAVQNDLKYISDDEFYFISNITITYDTNEQEKELENRKEKSSMHCSRM